MSGKRVLVSVVIPVYNAEKFLRDCLDSIIQQSLKDIEIILVDDCSVDNSVDICMEYLHKDDRIVFQKNIVNKGPQYSRYMGCRLAKGKYISFVDADDWIDEDFLAQAVDNIANADIVMSGCIKEYKGSSEIKYQSIPEGVYKNPGDLDYILSNMICSKENDSGLITLYLCDKVFLKDKVIACMEKCHLDLKYDEDTEFLAKYLLECNSISVFEYAGYHYRQHALSSMHKGDSRFLKDIATVYDSLYHDFLSHRLSRELIDMLQRYLLTSISLALSTDIMGLKEEYKIEYYLLPDIDFVGKNIVLYGAGDVGKAYHRQLSTKEDVRVVLWVDAAWENYAGTSFQVNRVSDIEKKIYDMVLVAVSKETLYLSIRDDLLRQGIPAGKIIWKKPQHPYKC